MTFKKWLLFVSLVSVSLSALGQSSSVQPVAVQNKQALTSGDSTSPKATSAAADDGSSKDKYSGEPVVIERLDTVYSFEADGTGWKQQTAVVRVQSDTAVRQLGVLNFAFASATQRVEIQYVRVRKKDGTVNVTPADAALEMPAPVTQEAPFYSDLKQMQIPVRNLQVGDRLEYQVKFVRVKAEAEGQFWGAESFEADEVALSQSLELRFPKNSYVKVWSPKEKSTETTEGTQHVFHWDTTQLKPTVGKEAEAEKEAKKKHVLTAEEQEEADEGKFPDVTWTSFRSWESIGAWYGSLEKDRVVPDAAVKAKVAEVTAGKSGDEEKAKAIYAYVATQIRYIGVAFGIGRYQPHRASEVLENQYGDCKDKHTLLAAMLTSIGLKPQAVLIGAAIRFNEDVPSPASFNHLITTVVVSGQQVWLDATAEVAPYRLLSFPIRDKQALVISEDGAAKVERTPALLPFPSVEKLEASGTLNKDGTAYSHIVWTMRGDDELVFRSVFHQTAANQLDEVLQRISQNLGFGGTITNGKTSRAEDTVDPFQFEYDYKRDKPGNDWDNLRVTALLAPIYLPRLDEANPPTSAIALGGPREEISSSTLKLPEGWRAVIPEAIHAQSPYAILDRTYRFDKGVLYAECRVQVLQKKVPVSEWKSYLKWTQSAQLDGEPYIQLETSSGGPASGKAESSADGTGKSADAASGSASSPEDTAKLIAAANLALRRHDLVEAQSLLDNAKAQSEIQEGLWSTYGYLSFLKGDLPSTIVDYKKEISLHPESYGTYPVLAQVQSAYHQKADAKETLQKWAGVQPQNPQPSIMLVSMLLEDQDASGAVTVAEEGLGHIPMDQDNARKNAERLRLLLGRAQQRAGMHEKSEATLLALMNSTEDPGMMNDSAFELADELGKPGADQLKTLALAESKARTALGKLEEESRSWTLDEDQQMLRGKSSLIAATWDTVGWILYREGKVSEAEPYIQAAWKGRPSLEVGEHMGEIDEAEGRKSEALAAFEEADASMPGYDAMGVRTAPTPEQLKLRDRVHKLRSAGAKVPAVDARERLQKARTISLGPAKGLSGVAEYRMLLRGGKVMKVEKSGSKEVPGGSDRLMQANLAELWPPGSDAALVRVGMLNCHGAVCELVLEP